MNPRGSRCICLWICSCVCFQTFLTKEVNDFCHSMAPQNEVYAGFIDVKNYEELESEMEESISPKKLLIMASVAMVLFLLFLGEFN